MTPVSNRLAGQAMRWSASTEEQLRFERLVSELSASFINMPAAAIDDAIREALRRIVELLGVERSTLSGVIPGTSDLETLHSSAADGLAALPRGSIGHAFPWVIAMARAGKPIVFSRLEELPPEAGAVKEWYRRSGLRSHIGVPVLVAGELVAILGFGMLRSERTWSSELVDRLKLVAEIFASALARKRAHEDVERALAFERLLVDVSASLIAQQLDEPDRAIDGALHAIGDVLAVDRTTLWSRTADGQRYEATHVWTAHGVAGPPSSIDRTMVPTVFGLLSAGAVANLASLDDLPAEAQEDKDALRRLGTRSLLVVPLVIDGYVVGALSLATLRAERPWPDIIVPRVRLIGEVFANVLTRRRAALEVEKAQSETAQYRERLAHLVRVHTVGEMSAAIAHEVNQPLMAIENYAQAAQRRLAGPGATGNAKLHELLDKIASQAARAGDVLKRLRSIVKKHDSEATLFDIGALVADTMNLVEMESRLKDVRIELEVAGALPFVLADEVQIQQVILNLARNGIEAMETVCSPRDKVLKAEVVIADAAEIVVRIVDRGHGISAVDAEHLFEPFYSTKEQGLGIGLAICRSIVEAHGGKLWYAPSAPHGTAFQFTLPIARETTDHDASHGLHR
jgi:signal transduction histidine kinase